MAGRQLSRIPSDDSFRLLSDDSFGSDFDWKAAARAEIEYDGAVSRPVRRTPKVQVARKVAYGWSTMLHRPLCFDMRSGKISNRSTDWGKVAAALDAYMRYTAPRAPTIPRGHGSLDPRRLVLWRGVGPEDLPRRGAAARLNGGCFSAFTYDRNVANKFAGPAGMLFRLEVRNVARSTPWAWFGQWTRERNMVGSQNPTESEVLLPPGYFRVLDDTPATRESKRVVSIAFAPEPRYLLKAHVPFLNQAGRAGVGLVGGQTVMFADARLRNSVRARREAVAGAAAARAARAARAGARRR